MKWTLLSLAGLLLLWLIERWEKYRAEKNGEAAFQKAVVLWKKGFHVPAISECERGLAHPTYKKSAKKKMANLYCQLQIDQRDPRYENALCYLKEEDVLLCRAKFAVWTGCREEGRRLCSELMAKNPKKFTSCAYKWIADSYYDEAEYEKGCDTYFEALEHLKKKERNSFAVRAFCGAKELGSSEKALRAISYMNRKTARNILIEKDELSSAVAAAKKKGISLESYIRELLAALRPYKRQSEAVIFLDTDTEGVRSYIGGARNYDDRDLAEKKSLFVAQIDFSEFSKTFPEEIPPKPYALRLWIHGELIYRENGVYGPEFFDIRKGLAKNFTPVAENETEQKQIKKFNLCHVAIPFRLVPFLEYPNACSSVTERFCEQSGMLSPLEAAGEKTLFSQRNSLYKVFGYPALEKNFEKVDSEYDLCLFKLLCADTMYVFCMRSADFIADNFEDIILVKQEKEGVKTYPDTAASQGLNG